MTEWDVNKVELINWCAFYHNLFVSPDDDRPPDDIIDKDALLDEWLDYNRFKKKNSRKSSVVSADSHMETFEAL